MWVIIMSIVLLCEVSVQLFACGLVLVVVI